MREKTRLAFLPRWAAVVAWAAWLASVLWMLILFWRQTLDANGLPVVGLLAIQLVAGVVGFLGAVWRLVRGPCRVTAAAWGLLALGPACLWATHFSYMVWHMQGRQLDPNWLLRVSRSNSLAIGDCMTWLLYRDRTEGERVVMIHNGLPTAKDDVAAMDRHLAEMEQRLGKTMQTKVRWVRGSLLGISGRGGDGWSLGSESTAEPLVDGLSEFDRHEAAHAILGAIDPRHTDPPAVLIEGWAETQSGYTPGFLSERAWTERRHGLTLPLDQLISDDWYRAHYGPVYTQGGPLVEYVIDEFGIDRFMELYNSCRRRTFAEDVQRVLGIGLSELDGAYWQWITETTSANDPHAFSSYVVLADGVDAETWQDFSKGHLRASNNARQMFERAQIRVHRVFDWPSGGAVPIHREVGMTILSDGKQTRVEHTDEEGNYVVVASPECSFTAESTIAEAGWTLAPSQDIPSLDFLYRRAEVAGYLESLLPHYSLVRGQHAAWNRESKPVITTLERRDSELGEILSIAFVARDTQPNFPVRGEFHVAVEHDWAITAYTLHYGTGPEKHTVTRSIKLLPQTSSPPAFRESLTEQRDHEDRLDYSSHLTMTHFEHDPEIPEDAFSPEQFDVEAASLRPASRPYWFLATSIVTATITLGGGMLLMLVARCLRC